MHTNVFWAVTAVLALGPPANGSDPPKVDPDVAKLVRELGNPRFAVREAAEKRLVELGPRVKAAVLAGTKDADAEVVCRCEAVLPRTQAAERQALLDETGDWPAPAGSRFRDMVGDSKEARTLFVEMTETDRRAGLADKAAADPARAAELYLAEVARVAAADLPNMRRVPGGESSRQASLRAVPPGDVALALFLGTFAAADGTPDPAQVTCLLRAGFSDLATGPQKKLFGKLFAAWLAHRSDPTAVAAALEAALATGLVEAVPVARRWVADPKASAQVVGLAAVVLGTHGSPDDLTLLSALRGDTRVYRGTPGQGSEVQVLDVAAGMSLILRGQDMRAFGFHPVHVGSAWRKSPDPCPYLDVGWLGPLADREASRKRVWQWLDQQAGAPAKPGK